MKLNIAIKTILSTVTSQTALDKWPFDDGTSDPYWAGGFTPKPYRWELDVTITTQNHGSHLTRSPNVYTGLDVKVGDWIAGAADGVALQIISIRSKTDSTMTCVVEDIYRYNTFRSALGDGLFSVPGDAIIFELNDDGDPMIDPIITSAVGVTSFTANLISRMKAFHLEDVQMFEQTAHGFSEGNLISMDSSGNFVKTDSTTMDRIVGTVYDDGPGPNNFLLKPTTKISNRHEPALPGTAGDFIYASTALGTDLTTTKTSHAAFIQLSDAIATISDGSVANGTTTTGAQMNINGTLITFDNNGGGTESIDDMVIDINAESGNTGVIASKVVITKTSLALVYGVVGSVIGAPGPASATINGSAVTFNNDAFGQYEFGPGLANEQDMANSINAAAIANIETAYHHEELIIVDTSGTGITIVNTGNDGSGNPFAGANSGSGIPLVTTNTFLRLSRATGGSMVLQNELGNPLGDLGLLSTDNGHLPIGLVVEQGIRKGDMYVVADITARDALDVLVGDQAHVLDKGDQEWGLYLYDGTQWTLTSSEESARTDSDTLSVIINHNDGGLNFLGQINAGTARAGSGTRVSPVSIEVIVPFNGNPTIEVGDPGDLGRLFTDDLVDLTVVGNYSHNPVYQYTGATDTNISVNFTEGGATVGQCRVTMTYS